MQPRSHPSPSYGFHVLPVCNYDHRLTTETVCESVSRCSSYGVVERSTSKLGHWPRIELGSSVGIFSSCTADRIQQLFVVTREFLLQIDVRVEAYDQPLVPLDQHLVKKAFSYFVFSL